MAATLFLDSDSEEDSIKTDYSTQDDEDTLYDIEQVLAHDKVTNKYLIKWSGYPLQEATWEPRDGLPEDGSEIWQQWHQHLRDVKEGMVPPFDLEEYGRLWETHRAIKNERRARRNAKRRKKNLPTRPDTLEQEMQDAIDAQPDEGGTSAEEDDSDDEPLISRRPPSRSMAQIPRKGVAQKLEHVRTRQRDDASSGAESGETSTDDSSSGDSLVDELAARKRIRMSPPVSMRRNEEVSRKRAQPAIADSISIERRAERTPRPMSTGRARRDSNQPNKSQPKQLQTKPTIEKSVAVAKSAPSSIAPKAQAARAKKSANVMSNWDANKQRRRRVPTATTLSTDIGDGPRFTHLRVQNLVNKHREAAPDISALNVVDPKTGKVKAAPPIPSSVVSSGQDAAVRDLSITAAGRIPGVYARRSPPPDNGTADSLPSEGAGVAGGPALPGNVAQRQSPTTIDPNPHFYSVGEATKIAGAAAQQLRIPPRDWVYNPGMLFCHFYRLHGGRCKQGRNCKFAHHDTGYDAPPPKVTIEDVRASQAAHAKRLTVQPERFDTNAAAQSDPTSGATPQGPIVPMSRDPQTMRTATDSPDLAPNRLTCYFWRTRGTCTKGPNCEFAHWDTGLDAAPPGSRKMSKAALGSGAGIQAPNAKLMPLGEHRQPTSQLLGMPTSDESSLSALNKPSAVQTSVLRSEVVASPGELTASPMHVSWNETTRPIGAELLPWSTCTGSTELATKSGSLELIQHGTERPYMINVKFDVLGERAFTRLVGEHPVLRVEESILISDVPVALWSIMKQSTEAVAGSMRLEIANDHAMSNLAEFCKLHSCALLASVDGHKAQILVYASSDDRWKFLEAPSLPANSDSSLRVCVFDGSRNIRGSTKLPRTSTRHDMRSAATIVGEELVKLQLEIIIPKESNSVFLMIPPAHAVELEVFRQILTGMKLPVYHSGTAGAWSYFRRKYPKSGVIFLHSSVPLSQVPGLYESVSGSATFFMMGPSAPSQDGGAVGLCTRILAQGAAILLTEDLITYHPDEATRIIQNFLDANAPKPEGGENNKIVARPGLKRFLMDIMKRRGSDERHLRLYGAVCDLCPPEDEEEDSDDPTAAAHLVSVNPELLPSLAGLWERDEIAASDLVVDWFAGWAELNAINFRRFIVCHQAKDAVATNTIAVNGKVDGRHDTDPRGWARKYQHIGVLPPGKVIEKFYKSTKPQQRIRRWMV